MKARAPGGDCPHGHREIRNRPGGQPLRGSAAAARRGRYVNDVSMARQAYAYFLRSPHAHAQIVAIDTAPRKPRPACSAFSPRRMSRRRSSAPRGWRCRASAPTARRRFRGRIRGLARGVVRYVGDPVAMVVAETLAQAKDAAELIEIEYEELPAVIDIEDALKPGAPRVWDENPDNVSHYLRDRQQSRGRCGFRGGGACGQAQIRHHPRPSRNIWSRAARSALTMRTTSASPCTPMCNMRIAFAICWPRNVFKIPETQIRVVTGDVGGGFGTKGWHMPSIA